MLAWRSPNTRSAPSRNRLLAGILALGVVAILGHTAVAESAIRLSGNDCPSTIPAAAPANVDPAPSGTALDAVRRAWAIDRNLEPGTHAIDVSAQSPSLDLSVSPAAPTTADVVAVHAGGTASDTSQRAWRVTGSRQFFAEVTEVPERATYVLGALAPGTYRFLLYRQVSAGTNCAHRLLRELRFTVEPARPRGSGQVVLLTDAPDRGTAQRIVRRQSPRLDWLFGRSAVVAFAPGLERSYRSLLGQRPEVVTAEFDSMGFVPECPPPFQSAHAPGSLLLSFAEGVDESEAGQVIGQVPPVMELVWPLDGVMGLSLTLVGVRVPPGWEALFLRRYSEQPHVLGGWVQGAPPDTDRRRWRDER